MRELTPPARMATPQQALDSRRSTTSASTTLSSLRKLAIRFCRSPVATARKRNFGGGAPAPPSLWLADSPHDGACLEVSYTEQRRAILKGVMSDNGYYVY